jgi:hypothetical protein
MIRRTILAALLGGVLAAPAVAQQVPTIQAGAGGRYETQIDPKTRVPGFSAAHVAAFRPRVGRVLETFAAMPQVTSPPAPVCHRLKSWISINPFHGVLAAEVGLMSPISFENGRCHSMTGTGVVARVNALSLLLDEQEAFVRTKGESSDWFLVPQAAAAARVVRIRDAVAFTHGRAPLLRPVSAERYLANRLTVTPADPVGGSSGELARWLATGKAKMLAENKERLREMSAFMKPADLANLAEAMQVVVDGTEKDLRREAAINRGPSERQRLEAQLASLSSSARAAPACFPSAAGGLDLTPGCPDGFILAELNPAYFDKSRPDAVQLLVIQTPEERTHGENDARLAARKAVWNALDHGRLAAIVE